MNENISGVEKDIIPLLKKINTAMGEIGGWVPKSGTNRFQNYSYTKESDLLAKVREVFVKNGIVLTYNQASSEQVAAVPTKQGGTTLIVRVKMIFRMWDMDTGAFIDSIAYGDGGDSSDKGIYKAITGATKYFLLKTMMMATGDDPEKEDSAQKRAGKVNAGKPAQQKPAGEKKSSGKKNLGQVKTGIMVEIKKIPTIEQRQEWITKLNKCTLETASALKNEVVTFLAQGEGEVNPLEGME